MLFPPDEKYTRRTLKAPVIETWREILRGNRALVMLWAVLLCSGSLRVTIKMRPRPNVARWRALKSGLQSPGRGA